MKRIHHARCAPGKSLGTLIKCAMMTDVTPRSQPLCVNDQSHFSSFWSFLQFVGVLILLCIPMTTKVDEVGYRHVSQNNLHQMGIACHDYHSNFGSLPAGMTLNQQGKMLH